MKIKITKAIAESYARHVATTVGGLVLATAELTHHSPVSFTAGDWQLVANGLWLAAVPQIRNYVQLKDPTDAPLVNYALNEVSTKLAPEPGPAEQKEGLPTT